MIFVVCGLPPFPAVKSLPESIQLAWHFLEVYRLALEALNSPAHIVLIEDYFHHFLVSHLTDAIASESEVSTLPSGVFAWPFDLPQPELVLFLTTSTSHRLERVARRDNQPLYTHDTGSMVQQRSTHRMHSKDAKSRAIYTAIRGPGTVGIDTTAAIEEVYRTVVEALDYYGVYSISRYTPSYDSFNSTSNNTIDVMANTINAYTHTVMEQDYLESASAHTSLTSNNSGQSSAIHKTPSLSSRRRESVEITEPIVSPEVITSRRVSMGVYGMYTRL